MKIIKGKIPCAKKVTIYGPEGIGKSTLASKFPDPIFIDTEGSTKEMDVNRFEKPSSWQMLLDQIEYVRSHQDICKTLVIDTIDWAETMCIEHICAKHHKDGLESFGYGNGYIYVKEEFGRFLNKLEEVVEKGINIVLTAHAQLRKFEQPDEMGAYDRYELKLGKKTASQTSPLVKEFSDMVLFANYKTYSVATDKDGKKHKAQGGKRIMYTTHHPCWDAKNRYGLPDEIPMDYEEIRHIIEGHTQKTTVTPPRENKPPVPASAKRSGPEPTAAGKSRQEPAKEAETAGPDYDVMKQPEPDKKYSDRFMNIPGEREEDASTVDERIPKALRHLMIENGVDEWDIQNVVAARGYFPADMAVADYPADFVSGVLVGAWPQVLAMIREMKEKDAIVFN